VANKISTRGGRVQERIDIVRAHGGIVSAVGVCRSQRGNKTDFGCPFIGLVEMSVENFPADNLPRDLSKIPAAKPDSK
jgi:orotate phosphoribosyltransferase